MLLEAEKREVPLLPRRTPNCADLTISTASILTAAKTHRRNLTETLSHLNVTQNLLNDEFLMKKGQSLCPIGKYPQMKQSKTVASFRYNDSKKSPQSINEVFSSSKRREQVPSIASQIQKLLKIGKSKNDGRFCKN